MQKDDVPLLTTAMQLKPLRMDQAPAIVWRLYTALNIGYRLNV